MSDDDQGLEALLEHLKATRGFDFTGYKRSSLQRRVEKRMGELGIERMADYLDHLEAHTQEFEDLFDTLLINVTGFFRDPAAWDHLRRETVPQILQRAGEHGPIRIWSAGCASGEEPYTLAMIFADAMGDEAYLRRVKIYATDLDQDALSTARHATYPGRAVESVPEALRERYLERLDGRYVIRTDLRRTVIFGRNDLVQDAPISRIDLLVCRNVLMYFNAESQARVLERFNFALKPDGFLFLGKSEMLITHTELFKPVSLKERVFAPAGRQGRLHERLAGIADAFGGDGGRAHEAAEWEAAFDVVPVAHMIVDGDGRVSLANAEARRLFGLSSADRGRLLQDLELSYRPVELRSLIEQARERGQAVEVDGLRYRPHGMQERILKVRVVQVAPGAEDSSTSVTYLDVTGDRNLQDELRRSKQDLESAYEELQSTVEELETTNEELQSTNEELETTNEELQSTNEELETMNEELQSTNEELETMNEELRERGLELNRVNAMTETILTSLGVSLLVVDSSQQIRIWNSHSEGVWGLRPEEAEGQHVLGLDIGFPVELLREPLRACLSGGADRQELVAGAVDRRGRAFDCRVSVLALKPFPEDGVVSGAMLLMEPVRG